MKEVLEAAANSLAAAAEHLRALAETAPAPAPATLELDPEAMGPEARDRLKDLVNVWLGAEWDKRFEALEAQVASIADEDIEALKHEDDSIRSDLNGEINELRDEIPDFDADDRQVLATVARFFAHADPNDLVSRDELPDFDSDFVKGEDFDADDYYAKSDFDIDDYVEKGDIPTGLSDFDLDDMETGARQGAEARDMLRGIDFDKLKALSEFLSMLGLDVEALVAGLKEARAPTAVNDG